MYVGVALKRRKVSLFLLLHFHFDKTLRSVLSDLFVGVFASVKLPKLSFNKRLNTKPNQKQKKVNKTKTKVKPNKIKKQSDDE